MVSTFSPVTAAFIQEINNFFEDSLKEIDEDNNTYYGTTVAISSPDSRMRRFQDDWDGFLECSSFFDERGMVYGANAIKIENGNITTVKSLIKKAAESEGLGIYGILLSDGKEGFFNPMHPMNVERVKNNDLPFNEFTIIIYPFTKNRIMNVSNEDVEFFVDDISEVMEAIQLKSIDVDIERKLATNVDRARKAFHFEAMSAPFSAALHSTHGVINFETINVPQHAVSAVENISLGIRYPYYGMVAHEMSDDQWYYSVNLFPFLSGNINASEFFEHYDDGSTDDVYPTNLVSTCLGDFNPSNFEHLKVIGSYNTHSAYFNSSIPNVGAMEFIKACQVYANDIINTKPKETRTDVTQETQEKQATQFIGADGFDYEDNKANAVFKEGE